MRDLYSNLKSYLAMIPAAQTATVTGSTVDTLGLKSVGFLVTTGALVGSAIFGVALQESDDGSTWSAANALEVQTDAPAVLLANTVYRLGYLGSKRFARIRCLYTSGTSLVIGGVAIGEPTKRPVA
jgi:hypothetical protein